MQPNYVANMYINAVRLSTCLEDPTDHRKREDGRAEWEENSVPVNLDQL